MEVCGQGHVLTALPLGKGPGTHCIGGWITAVDYEVFE